MHIRKNILLNTLVLFLIFISISCKEKEAEKSISKKEKIKPFLETPPLNNPTFREDKTKEYEYRTGNSGDYTYNYNAFGFDSEGNEVNGNITVNGKYGNGILTDKNGNEINIDTEWTGYGKLKAIDEEGNEYELEVDEQ